MGGDRLFLVCVLGIGNVELDNSVIVGILIVNGMSGVIGEGNHLLGYITLSIVIILNGIDDNLRCYDLAIQLDICLGSTNDPVSLVLIIYN